MTTNDPRAAYDAAVARLNSLQLEASSLERRAGELQGRIRAEDGRDTLTYAARAMLDGKAPKGAQDAGAEMEETRTRLGVTRRAVELQRGRVDASRRERDEAINDAHEAKIHQAAQALAAKLAEVGDAAEGLHAALGDLDAEGVQRAHRFPVLRLDPLRSSLDVSRVNHLLDELEKGYGVKVDRSTLLNARKRRHKAHEADQERRRKAGGMIAAGPDGVREYLPGGKVKPPVDAGPRAGADDFKTAAAWGLA